MLSVSSGTEECQLLFFFFYFSAPRHAYSQTSTNGSSPEPSSVQPLDSLSGTLNVCEAEVDLAIVAILVDEARFHSPVLGFALALDVFC